MYIVGVGLVRPLQSWDILLIYCNNQLKKYIALLLRLASGALSIPLLMSMSEAFSVPFYTLIKLCYTKALEWSSLVPDPEARSSLEITNLTLFTISDQHIDTISSLHSAYGGIKTTHMLKERKIHTMKNTEIWSCFASCPKLARIQLVL